MSFGSPFGHDFRRARLSLRGPVARQFLWKRLQRHRLRAQALRRSSNAIARGLVKACSAVARRPDPLWRAASASRKAVSLRRRPGLFSPAACVQAVCRRIERSDILRVGRARTDPLWIEDGSSTFAAFLICASFSGCPSGTKFCNVIVRATCGSVASCAGRCRCIGKRGLQNFDRVDPRVRIVSQFQKRRDRFDFRASQVQRVEIEAQIARAVAAPPSAIAPSAPRSRSDAVP